ncbi:glycosyltransferase [Leeuwenhoekiella palythoae]|uniref:Glycosyltransferase involved in cell wall biosynthesis n=1 Tax=Leeuwenhoekiella palythoae TaxID=573501 RepID=A0A1M5UCY3_9FLAO|nr:glycosyltransferase [Leeuwenhoekiella palythoae]RXG27159.1 glycosyltransferase involved in cell wall biosynthesis [Leeuwenhoekiella palythoae]SHH60800.1 Glycosyltransferase involved in cell wall bisynthesis [Leeuwenhoekiella palythoae]
MKVLHILTSLNPIAGGVAKAVDLAVCALDSVGFASEVVCFDEPEASFLRSKHYEVYALGPANNMYSYTENFKEWARVHLRNYDHIILHGLWQYSSYGGYLFWRKYASTSSLWVMPHGMLDPYFQKAKDRRLKAIRNWFFWKFLERQVVNNSNGLLFTCLDELKLARTTFKPYNPKSEIVVGLGIDSPISYSYSLSEAFKSTIPALNERPYFLFLGRVDSKKGVDLLVKAYRSLRVKHADIPDLVIAGPGLESAYGQQVLSDAAGDDRIHFPGMLQGAAKWGALYGAQNFILPSHQENFGIAVVEALACGTPVLISKQVNIWREIIKEEAGIAEADTLEGTINLLERWLNFSEEQRRLKKDNASKAYRQYFTTNAFGENLRVLFNK